MKNSTHELTAERLLAETDWMRTLARALARDPEVADDLVQDTWLAALRRPPSTERSLRPWLGSVMRNFARERFRTRERRKARESEAAELRAELPSPRDLAERVELQQLVVRIVMDLPQSLRTTVLLCYFEGLEPSEIARRTGEPAGTVRWRLKQGLDRVREELDRRHGGDRQKWQLALATLCRGPRETATAGAAGALSWIVAAVIGLGVAGYWFTRPTVEESLAQAAAPTPAQVEIVEQSGGDTRRAAVSETRAAPSAMSRVKQQRSWLSGVQEFFGGPLTRVRVRFVDEHAQPLAGVRLRAGSSGVVLTGTSGRDGVVELESRALREARAIDFHALDGAERMWEHEATVVAGDDVDLGDVELVAGVSVSGRITDLDGAAAPGVDVVVARANTEPEPFDASKLGPLGEPFWRGATTDTHGRFELVGLPPGAARVWANGGELGWSWSQALTLEIDGERQHVELRLRRLERPPPIVVEVRAPDSSQVRNALFKARGPHGRTRSGQVSERIEFDDPTAFPVVSTLWVADASLRWGPVRADELAPQKEPHVLTLTEPLRLALDVVDDLGAAVEDASVVVRDEQTAFELPAQTSSSPVVLPSAFALEVSAPGHAVTRVDSLVHDGQAAPLRVVLERLHVFEGRVVGPEGPIANTWVWVTRAAKPQSLDLYQGAPTLLASDPDESARTDAEGRFDVTLREADSWIVECHAEGLAPHREGPIWIDPRVAREPLEIRVGRGGRIEGVVRFENGSPARGQVVGLSRGDRDVRTARADKQGRFEFELVAAGDWYVYPAREMLDDNSYVRQPFAGVVDADWRHPSNCTVREGETSTPILELEPIDLRRCELVVRIDGRAPPRWDAVMWPLRSDPFDPREPSREARLDSQGRASLEFGGRGAWRMLMGIHATFGWDGDAERLGKPLELDIATGTLRGSVAERVREETLSAVWQLGDGWFAWRLLKPGQDGAFSLDHAPLGRGAIVRGYLPASPSSTWRLEPLAEFELTAGATCVVDVR